MRKAVVRNCLAYAIAVAIVCYAARGVSWRQVAGAGSHATLWIFAVASLGGFLCWFIGETVLYSCLFSYFHAPRPERSNYFHDGRGLFLQIVNSYVASGVFVLFLHARKRVPWIMSGCTLLFEGYVVASLLATLSLLVISSADITDSGRALYTPQACWGGPCSSLRFGLFGDSSLDLQLAPMDLRTAFDGEFPHGAAVALYQAPLH